MLLRCFRGRVTRLPKSTVWLRCCWFDGASGNNENIDAIVDHAAASFLDFASRKDVKLYRTIMTKAASMHSNAERLAYVGPATLRARIDAKWFAKWIWDILQENGNVPSPQADAMYATDEHVTKFRTTVLPLFVKDDSAELMMTEIDPLLRKLPRGIADDVISALRRIAKIEESDDNRSTSINTEFLKFNRTHKPTFVDILSYLNVHSKPTRSVRKKVDQPSAQFREAVVEYIRSIRRDAVTSPDVSCGNNTADSESAYSESSSTMEESLAPPPQAAGVDTSNPRRRGRSINASTIFACNVKVREKSSVLAQHSSALTEEDDEAVAEEISQENRALYCSRTGKEMPLHPLDESFAPDVEYDGVFDTVFEPPRPTNLNEKPEDEPDDRVLVDEDIMVKARATAPARRKIMIINLPVTCDTSDVRKAFRKCGKITDITLCHSHNPLWDKVKELQEATKVKKRGRAPKVSAKDAAIKAAINSSDVYAFFKAYKDSYDEIMCPDLKVFGMCIQNQRCRVDDAANYKKLYVEVQRDLPLEKTIALLQELMGADYHMVFDANHAQQYPLYLTLSFPTHEEAWRAFFFLQIAVARSAPITVAWIKTKSFYEKLEKLREFQRTHPDHLDSIASVKYLDTIQETKHKSERNASPEVSAQQNIK